VTARVAISPLAYGREAVGHVSEKREWRVPRLVEVFYPLKFNSTQDRHNWIAAMMLDSRLRDRDKVILIRLALHLNLKTGRLDPTIHLLALETSLPGSEESTRRMVRRSLERAEKIGWIERTGRHGGSRLNRSNSYRLTIPTDVRPDKSDRSRGQMEQVGRTPESPRIGKENREREHSVSSIQHRLLTQRDALSKKNENGGPSEDVPPALRIPNQESWGGYTEGEIELVRDMILAHGLDTIAAIVNCAREQRYFITGNVIAAMCRDGHFVRSGERIFVREENEKDSRYEVKQHDSKMFGGDS
jgi:hypothetical protein